jgi:cytochrome P450
MLGLKRLFGRGTETATAQVFEPPVLPLNLSAPAFVRDPYPTYAWLRANAPVAEIAGGGFLITRHADVMAAFTDPNLGNAPSRFSTLNAKNAGKYVAADLASHIPPFLDAPAHIAVRCAVSRAFFAAMRGFETRVAQLAEARVAALRDGDDLIGSGAQPFALEVMNAFCGVDVSAAAMKSHTMSFFHLFAPLKDPAVFAEVNEDMAAFRAVMARSYEARIDGSFIAHLRAAADAGAEITADHVIDNAVLVYADGVENVEAAVASLMLVFEAEGLWQALRAGDVDLEAAVREGLRLQTPAQFVPRVARAAHERSGVAIAKDMPVFLGLGSANWDAEAIADADLFDLGRGSGAIVTFGQGRHRCIGEPLGVMQITVFLRALIAQGVRPAARDVTYHARPGHRWPEALPIRKGA